VISTSRSPSLIAFQRVGSNRKAIQVDIDTSGEEARLQQNLIFDEIQEAKTPVTENKVRITKALSVGSKGILTGYSE
jgi:hypothetical protein